MGSDKGGQGMDRRAGQGSDRREGKGRAGQTERRRAVVRLMKSSRCLDHN